jgi:hypothetical protein
MARQLFGPVDVPRLRTLVAAAEQQDRGEYRYVAPYSSSSLLRRPDEISASNLASFGAAYSTPSRYTHQG